MVEIRPIPDIEYELALLLYIHNKGEVRPFLRATGNDMKRLCSTVDRLIDTGIVERQGLKLLLTDMASEYINVLNKHLGRKGLYSYLIPDYTVRRVQMKATDTYIPKYMIQRGGSLFSNSLVRGRSDESSGDNETPFKHNK